MIVNHSDTLRFAKRDIEMGSSWAKPRKDGGLSKYDEVVLEHISFRVIRPSLPSPSYLIVAINN